MCRPRRLDPHRRFTTVLDPLSLDLVWPQEDRRALPRHLFDRLKVDPRNCDNCVEIPGEATFPRSRLPERMHLMANSSATPQETIAGHEKPAPKLDGEEKTKEPRRLEQQVIGTETSRWDRHLVPVTAVRRRL